MSKIEEMGRPALALTARHFMEDARWSAKVWGRPDLGIVEVEECITNNTPEKIRAMVDGAMARVVHVLTRGADADFEAFEFKHISAAAGAELIYDGRDQLDCLSRMNEDFVKRFWSDGFPLLPPTRDRVDAMIEASGLDANHLVGLFEPGICLGTVEKIAANAVMAGCKPEMMPVVIAMAECMVDPLIDWRGTAISTGPQAPVVMVSGSYAQRIGMNAGVCAVGPGSISRVNVAIGRTAQLIRMNVGHAYPGVSDMDTIGNTMKFGCCVAENEPRNPWEPYRVTKGFSRDSSTVTVNCPFSATAVFDFANDQPGPLIEVFCSTIRNTAACMNGHWLDHSDPGPGHAAVMRGDATHVIFLGPDHASVFHRAGWSLGRIREALFEGSKMSFRDMMLNKNANAFRARHPDKQWLWDKPESILSPFIHAEQFDIFVVGGEAGWSLFHDGGSYSITREIRVPD